MLFVLASKFNGSIINLFKAFYAPCYLGFNTTTGKYIDLVKTRILERNDLLIFELYADKTDFDKLSTHDDKTWDNSIILNRADNILTKNVSWTTPDKWYLVGKINGVEAWGADLRMINDGNTWKITID